MDWTVLFCMLCDQLRCEPNVDTFLWSDGDEILCLDKRVIDALADMLERNGGSGSVVTGYYDPIEDIKDDCVNSYTGYHYLTIE